MAAELIKTFLQSNFCNEASLKMSGDIHSDLEASSMQKSMQEKLLVSDNTQHKNFLKVNEVYLSGEATLCHFH